ncbi:hypothetical protein TPA0907_13830 [Micromonospora humidisoli]|uniref:hypothetical protein n=1 Tax=Micromonospora sp. AKA109 TaxID=2733865 RepID=UPI0022C57089|nr:hypothetical protein [Micromonospora sp. AKA109]GHJ07016.1 hypothetical protein TPA0907_13830 [Micromonospora sp. AKA109]
MSGDDLPLLRRVPEPAGGTLSAACRRQRFCGMLPAEPERAGNERGETHRVHRTGSGKHVVHRE